MASEADETITTLNALKVKELKARLATKGLPVSGTKRVLVERLLAASASPAAVAPSPRPSVAAASTSSAQASNVPSCPAVPPSSTSAVPASQAAAADAPSAAAAAVESLRPRDPASGAQEQQKQRQKLEQSEAQTKQPQPQKQSKTGAKRRLATPPPVELRTVSSRLGEGSSTAKRLKSSSFKTPWAAGGRSKATPPPVSAPAPQPPLPDADTSTQYDTEPPPWSLRVLARLYEGSKASLDSDAMLRLSVEGASDTARAVSLRFLLSKMVHELAAISHEDALAPSTTEEASDGGLSIEEHQRQRLKFRLATRVVDAKPLDISAGAVEGDVCVWQLNLADGTGLHVLALTGEPLCAPFTRAMGAQEDDAAATSKLRPDWRLFVESHRHEGSDEPANPTATPPASRILQFVRSPDHELYRHGVSKQWQHGADLAHLLVAARFVLAHSHANAISGTYASLAMQACDSSMSEPAGGPAKGREPRTLPAVFLPPANQVISVILADDQGARGLSDDLALVQTESDLFFVLRQTGSVVGAEGAGGVSQLWQELLECDSCGRMS